ncbi:MULTISPECIES: TRAP transporter substrate-binding protein [unclassified Aurantimonas]|uniref:TRAP transporter substrate-binding protein n=1 Tax=unclassified Aurantimonas TaxID=2638230 RepID=UPI002E188B3D|nr:MULTISPECIES: TRAP transporter substrate-binding protein [unclassified Aurantimonas]MEC5293116.1 TRAP transporter substrate-binding protein [Aurantimonas sp. C2-3-R2]MEC5414185.1 TRAP transporter substrate-binding protein [Aurantimonas sp. C2-4-R8]
MTIRQLAVATIAACTFISSAFAAEITLKASHNANQDEPYHVGMDRMSELLEEKTDGQATIEVYPNAQLGDEMESIQGTQLGTVDIAVTADAVLANSVPSLSVFSLPFLFQSPEHMDAALRDPQVLEYVNELLSQKGFRLLGLFSAGTRHIMSVEPVEAMADLQDMKIRTMQNPSHIDAFRAFGANPTPIPYTELYGALETGVVDGAEAANTNYHSKNFYEVAPNWALIGWLELVAPVIMGEQRFQQLPEDVQTALLEAGQEAAQYEREAYRQSDKERLDMLGKEGVNITVLDPEPFREAAEAVYEQHVDTEEEKRLLELIRSSDKASGSEASDAGKASAEQ